MLTFFVLVPLLVLLLLNISWRALPRIVPQAAVLVLGFADVVFGLALPSLPVNSEIPVLSELHFGLVADDLTRVFLVSIGLVICAAAFVNQESMTTERSHRNFCSLLLVSLIGMNGAVLLSDFFSLYVFLEVTAIASFILIAIERGIFAVEGAFRYLLLSAVAAMFMLTGVGLLVFTIGDTTFSAVHESLNVATGTPLLLKMAVGIFIVGLFIKGGLVPFHGWLPGAYSSAPPGVSILLAGIVTKVSGIYALVRIAQDVLVSDPSLSMILPSGLTCSNASSVSAMKR